MEKGLIWGLGRKHAACGVPWSEEGNAQQTKPPAVRACQRLPEFPVAKAETFEQPHKVVDLTPNIERLCLC